MRRIVGYRQSMSWLLCASRFSSIQKFTGSRAETLLKEEESNMNEFSNQLMKVYIFDEMSKSFNRYAEKSINRIALLHPEPFREMLTWYFKYARRGFDDALLATIVKGLGRAMKCARLDHHVHQASKYLPRQVFASDEFINVINQIKYALKEGVYINPNNFVVIIQGLIDMEYVDKELCEQIYQKIYKKLLNQTGNLTIDPENSKNPNIEKTYYYFAGDLINKKKLLANPKFNEIVDTLCKREDDRLRLKEDEQNFKSNVKQIFGTDSEQILAELQEIRSEVFLSRENIVKFVDGIISIRERYLKMCKAQRSNKSILTDPNMNLGLLELEEQLLNLNLITLEEIQNLELLENSKTNINTTKSIVENLLKVGNTGKVARFIEEILGLESIKPRSILIQTRNPYNQDADELAILARCISKLAELTSLPVRDVKEVGLVHGQWEKILLEKNPEIFNDSAHELKVDRILKARYLWIVQCLVKHFEQFYKCYSESNYKARIMFAQALIKLGLNKQGFQLILNYKASRQNFDLYTPQQIFNCVEVYNSFSSTLELGPEKTHIIRILENLFDSGALYAPISSQYSIETQFGLYEKCTIINWLYNIGENKGSLYNKLKNALAEEVKGISNPEAVEGYGYAAAILKWSDSNIIEPQNSPFNFRKYDNPILDIFKKTFNQYLKTPQALHSKPYINIGFSSLQSDRPTLLYLVPQALTSLDGEYIDGNLQAYLGQMKDYAKIELKTLSISQLFRVDFSKHIINLLPRDSLEPFFDAVLKRDNDVLSEFVAKFSSSLIKIVGKVKQPSFRTTHAIQKITQTLQTLNKYSTQEKTVRFYNVALINRFKMIYLLSQLPSQLELLDSSTLSELNKSIFHGTTAAQFVQKTIKKVSVKGGDFQKGLEEFSFAGKRQTIELAQEVSKEENGLNLNLTDFELIDQEVHGDKTYNQYDSWSEELSKNLGEFNYTELELEKCSVLTRAFLINKINAPKTFSITPSGKPRQIVAPAHPLDWEIIYRDTPDAQLSEAQKIEKLVRHPVKTTPDLRFITSLLNFKFSLKSKCITEVCELLTKFDFIENLVKHHLSADKEAPSHLVRLATRTSEDYFDYLKQKSLNYITNSPYLDYLFSKLQRHQKLKEMFKILEETKTKARVLIKQKKLTFKDYTTARLQLENKIMKEIESFEDELVDSKVVVGASSTLKMFKTQINQQELSRFINKANFYRSTFDKDVIVSDGNYDQALQIKRVKSEQKLIKSRILYKLGYKIELSPLEKQYLEKWKAQQLPIPKSYTAAVLGDLSKNDVALLNQYLNLAEHKDYGLTELILEFALFFDDKAVNNFDSQIHQQVLQKKYGLPNILFEEVSNKATSYFLNQMEKREFDNSAKLNDQDIENVLKISQFIKTQNPFDKQIYNKIYYDARQDLDKINLSSGRNHLIAAWSEAKEKQFDLKYQADKFLKQNKEDIKQIWKKLNGLNYDAATEAEVNRFSDQLCERLYILKKNPPVYFSQLIMSVLLHPKLSDASRKNLLGTIELLKIHVDFFSSDIIQITKRHHSAQPLPLDQLTNRLHKTSKNFSRELFAASSL